MHIIVKNAKADAHLRELYDDNGSALTFVSCHMLKESVSIPLIEGEGPFSEKSYSEKKGAPLDPIGAFIGMAENTDKTEIENFFNTYGMLFNPHKCDSKYSVTKYITDCDNDCINENDEAEYDLVNCTETQNQYFEVSLLSVLAKKLKYLANILTYRYSGCHYDKLLENVIRLLGLYPPVLPYFSRVADMTSYLCNRNSIGGTQSYNGYHLALRDYYKITNLLKCSSNASCDHFCAVREQLESAIDSSCCDEEISVGVYYERLLLDEVDLAKFLLRVHCEIAPYYVDANGAVIFQTAINNSSFADKNDLLQELVQWADYLIDKEFRHALRKIQPQYSYTKTDSRIETCISIGGLYRTMYFMLMHIDFSKYGYYKCKNPRCQKYVLKEHHMEENYLRLGVASKHTGKNFCTDACQRQKNKATYADKHKYATRFKVKEQAKIDSKIVLTLNTDIPHIETYSLVKIKGKERELLEFPQSYTPLVYSNKIVIEDSTENLVGKQVEFLS